MKFEKVDWHDGNIKNFNYKFPTYGDKKTSIEIILELYKNEAASVRQDYQVIFPRVTEIIKTIDFNEITDNVGAGSINWISQKEVLVNKKKYYMYKFDLFGGKIIFFSGKARIKNSTRQFTKL